jgi:hypothetical protein
MAENSAAVAATLPPVRKASRRFTLVETEVVAEVSLSFTFLALPFASHGNKKTPRSNPAGAGRDCDVACMPNGGRSFEALSFERGYEANTAHAHCNAIDMPPVHKILVCLYNNL